MKKKNLDKNQLWLYKKKKKYLEFFNKDDLLLLKKVIYRDNNNNTSALHIKRVLKPLARRALDFKELRRLWFFLCYNNRVYKEYGEFFDYMNDEHFTQKEMSKIEDFFLEHTFDNISYIEVKKRLYNGNLKINDFKKIKKILYKNIDSYYDYMIIKNLLEKCLSNNKNYSTWLTELNKEKEKIKSKLTRDELKNMVKNYHILSQTEIEKVHNLTLDLKAGGGGFKEEFNYDIERYFKYNYYNFHFNLYKGSSFTEHPFKTADLDFDYDVSDYIDTNIPDSDLEVNANEVDLDGYIALNYNYNILNLIQLNYYNYLNNMYLYYCNDLFLDFFNYISIENDSERDFEVEYERDEDNYVYFPFRLIERNDLFKLGFGKEYDFLTILDSYLEIKHLLGSHETLDYTLSVNADKRFSLGVKMNAFSWYLIWRDELMVFKHTLEYGYEMLMHLEKQDFMLKEKKNFLTDGLTNKADFIIDYNINLSVYKPKFIKPFSILNVLDLFNNILVKNINKYILNFKIFKEKNKLNIFFRLNINLSFIRCRHIFLIKTIIIFDYYRVEAYLKFLEINIHDHSAFMEIFLNIIDHKERSKE